MAERRHFEEGGADYARHRPTYPRHLAEALAADCARTEHALDVGCGTGQLSVLLAEVFERVTATDPSETQIANATPRRNLTYAVGTAERIDLADGSVDLVVAAQAAHWFDLPAFYAEARRVARPQAALALVSYGVPALAGPAGERFRRFYWQDIHRHWPKGRAHVEAGYRTLAFPFAEHGLPSLSIERSWSFDELAGYVGTWSAVKQARKAGEAAVVETGLAEIRRLWGDGAQEHRITWPVVARIATLR